MNGFIGLTPGTEDFLSICHAVYNYCGFFFFSLERTDFGALKFLYLHFVFIWGRGRIKKVSSGTVRTDGASGIPAGFTSFPETW